MDGLSIELTNVCNRRCLHCFRNQADPPGFLSLSLAREVLGQARDLGFHTVCLTGGEVALYPHLEEFLALVVDQGFTVTLVTNGHRFQENLLPLLLAPDNREKLSVVCFSLDGASPETHDALRGPGSFREVVKAATLCQFKGIPFTLKSVITNFNKKELTNLALFGATLGAQEHGFLHPLPTPRAIREGVIPPPAEVREIMEYISGTLAKAMRTRIYLEGFGPQTTLFTCPNTQQCAHLDFQGNLVLCCNLSHITLGEGNPSVLGREWLADLQETPLREGLVRHFHGVARLMEARLGDMEKLADLTLIPCYWCIRHFGKLEWLRDFPESPWAAGVLEERDSYVGV
jgi:sulfatase maturation enzyme AslB (radical SAM superfamily)